MNLKISGFGVVASCHMLIHKRPKFGVLCVEEYGSYDGTEGGEEGRRGRGVITLAVVLPFSLY